MEYVNIYAGGYEFTGKLHFDKAPQTCDAFMRMLPFENKLIHVRWSGQGVWIPFGDKRINLEYENHTSHPNKGEILLYPGGISEMEIILSYGRCLFSSQVGQLAGNHFITITEGIENLEKLGEKILWEGAQPIKIELKP